MKYAIVRSVSFSIDQCTVTFMIKRSINYQKAQAQHQQYVNILAEMGREIICLPEEPNLPDAVFVEDPVVILDEVAVISTTGEEIREGEMVQLKPVIEKYRQCKNLELLAILEGGDVLKIEKTIYVGISSRTNEIGVYQFEQIVEEYGYTVIAVPVMTCLHLKTGISYIGNNTLLVNKDWVDTSRFSGFDLINVDRSEAWAANALELDGTVLFPSTFPKTQKLLERRGFNVKTVNISELQKAEGGLTCMSLIFDT